MTFPVQIGLPQIILLLIGLSGIALLVTAVVGLRPPGPARAPDARDGVAGSGAATAPAARRRLTARLRRLGQTGRLRRLGQTGRLRRLRLRRAPRWRRGVSGMVLITVAVSLLWFTALAQSYLGLTGEIRAAHVTATPVENVPHTLSVELTLYDDKGKTRSRRMYQVEGDRWVLQANIVELEHWVNVLGVHSGYRVTRLYGQYADGTPPTQHHIFLNGGDDDFFTSTQKHRWWTKPVVRSAYGNAVIANAGEYEVFVSQDAIKARRAGGG